ncbi:hypothetical protein LPJ61_002092 [Coemansia biformis]|uniref:SYO1-like TPR repeats domain-containing protein n=1 Tax=Coemansia biformis TaxID=1286918 RepID=A0A9W7YD41_9FUNG|nr:hypothetical protein LPJ61_002092 [Coemansia biformis]
MGKAQKRSFKSRTNPLGVSAVEGAATAVPSKEEIPVLLKKLSSSDANDRVWAAASASNLLVADDARARRMLLAHGVVSALVERLSDSVPDVVVQASGALYNLAAVDQVAAEEMGRTNIYMAIQTLIPRLAKSIDGIIKQNSDGQQLGAEDRKVVYLTTDNLISILRTLCETVPSSLKQINSMALIPFLISFFKVVGKVPASLVQTAGQLLHTLTDENAPAKRALLSHADSVDVLHRIVRTEQFGDAVSEDDAAIVRVLAGAVLINLKEMALGQLAANSGDADADATAEGERLWEETTRAILQTITKLVSFDTHAAAARSAALVKADAAHRASSMADGAAAGSASPHEAELDRLRAQMDYVQVALELAANIFADEGASEDPEGDKPDAEDADGCDDGDDGDDNDENADGDDDVDDDDMDDDDAEAADSDSDTGVDFDQADMDNVLGNESEAMKETEEAVHQSILGVFIDSIIPPLLRLAEPTRMSTLAAAAVECSAGPGEEATELAASMAECFVALHERALSCFNNFLLVVEESLQPWFRIHADRVGGWWQFLIAVAEHLFKADLPATGLSDADQQLRAAVLEPAVSCMWTLTRNTGGFVPATPDHIDGLIHICETAPTAGLRVKAVGALGNIARRQPGFVNENKRIGEYLLDSVIVKPLSKPSQPKDGASERVAAEPVVVALDLLFDIYGDMAYDYDEPVFVRGGFLARLRQLDGPMRKLSRTVDRRKNRGLRDRSDLATQNLRAFVEYKATER